MVHDPNKGSIWVGLHQGDIVVIGTCQCKVVCRRGAEAGLLIHIGIELGFIECEVATCWNDGSCWNLVLPEILGVGCFLRSVTEVPPTDFDIRSSGIIEFNRILLWIICVGKDLCNGNFAFGFSCGAWISLEFVAGAPVFCIHPP